MKSWIKKEKLGNSSETRNKKDQASKHKERAIFNLFKCYLTLYYNKPQLFIIDFNN